MSRQIRKDAHCLDLNLLVLSREQVILKCVEHLLSDLDLEKGRLRRIVIQDVRDGADRVQDKLLILIDIPAVDSLADLLDEFTEQLFHAFESFQCELLLSRKIGKQFDYLGESILKVPCGEFLILSVSCLLLCLLCRGSTCRGGVFFKVEDCELGNYGKAGLFLFRLFLAKFLPCFFKVGGQVAKDVGETD